MAKITFFVGTDANCYGIRKLDILMQEPEMFVWSGLVSIAKSL